jgi:molybdopterin-guanine dinucleotide biosynthesis protein A
VIGAQSFVLAGGQSSRMGQDKALLPLQGTPLLALALQKLRALGGPPPQIVGSRSDLSAYAPVLPDLRPGCGPLSGIEAALAATTQPLNLFLPVDLPLLPANFLAWMLARAQVTGALMTVPRILGRPQPLCAVYHRQLLAPVTAALLAGNYKVMAVMTAASSRAGDCDLFDVERIASADPDLTRQSPVPLYRWFHNCNTPDDMAAMGNALVLSA